MDRTFGIADAAIQIVPNGTPSAPISIAVCALNWVAMSPPRLAPIGTAPHDTIR